MKPWHPTRLERYLSAFTPTGRERLGEWRRLFCANGHEMTEANTYVRRDGYQRCRACLLDSRRRWRLRQKEAA